MCRCGKPCRQASLPGLRLLPSEDGEVYQHRDDADHDHDDAHDVLGAAVEWQQVDQIEDENDNQKRDQHTDQNIHTWLLVRGETVNAPEFQGALRPVLTGQSEKSSMVCIGS